MVHVSLVCCTNTQNRQLRVPYIYIYIYIYHDDLFYSMAKGNPYVLGAYRRHE
jgi:hypothetical protein